MPNSYGHRAPSLAPLPRLSEDDLLALHGASLEILERIGVRFYEAEALQLMKHAGCHLEDGTLVKIPAWRVEQALRSAPKRLTLCNRDGQRALHLEGHNHYFGPGSDCLHIVDHRNGQRRRAVLQDVVEAAVLCEALPHVDFAMSMFYPSDVSADLANQRQMEIMLNHTRKPIVFVTDTFEASLDVVAMAEAVAGGPEALQQQPSVACYVNVTTPLRHNQEALQKLLYFSDKQLPFVYVPAVRRGFTSPMTIAGSIALNNAGGLAGLVLSQLRREGTPFIYCAGGAVQIIDMRRLGSAYAAPDGRLYEGELPAWYGLPRWGLAGCSDSKKVDEQAAVEAALTLLVDVHNGCHLIHDLGYLEGGLSGSLAMLAICDEIVGWIKRLKQPLQISPESLALDLIAEVGPDGQFLDQEHTLQHVREDWLPDLVDRQLYENWADAGELSLRDRASRKVSELLNAPAVATLAPAAAHKLREIVERAAGR
jgi:trimethylamine--corrinoid protein Co-methyltransferase